MAWQDVVRTQHGLILTRQLRDNGVSESEQRTLQRRGVLVAADYHGLWVSTLVRRSDQRDAWRAVLTTGGLLSHRSAARLWKLPVPAGPRIEVIVPSWSRVRMPRGVMAYRVAQPAHGATFLEGLPISTRAHALIDCLGLIELEQARQLLDHGLQIDAVSLAMLKEAVDLAPGRRGNKQLRTLIAELGESEGERRLHRLFRRNGISGWAANGIVDVGFTAYRVDVLFEEVRLVVEFDGRAVHTLARKFQADRTKQNVLTEHGWVILRFTWRDVVERESYVIHAVRAALQNAKAVHPRR